MGAISHFLYIIPYNLPGFTGFEFFSLFSPEYSYSFTKNLFLIISNSIFLKNSVPDRHDNVTIFTNRVYVGVQWIFVDKSG